MARLHQRALDIEAINFVQHALNQPFNRIFRRTIRSQARDPERPRGRAKNQVTAHAPLTEMRQRALHNIQRAHKIGLELIAYIVLLLVFTRSNHAVPRAIGDNVDAAKVGDRLVDCGLHRLSRTNIAEETKAVFVFGLEAGHVGGGVLKGAANRCNEVIMGKGGLHEGATHVSGGAEYL
ncbi:conserved hypothetical protein [Uncinocarpus reesii 1704]|uniref:Uncharacterized protein n=1 Tax=Uncinocarpus reesii (strain UAMH 1704) TaxID=336963 RepID=C4JP36_UNCRE|nr:uncharacterized protein UREG_03095 [Uncinocarpus reesii 1704]EEP78250.1 conserved hypothetical protein [Uncinocarpus reesii 1704]